MMGYIIWLTFLCGSFPCSDSRSSSWLDGRSGSMCVKTCVCMCVRQRCENRFEYHNGKLCLSLLQPNRRQAVESAKTSHVPGWPAVCKSASRSTQTVLSQITIDKHFRWLHADEGCLFDTHLHKAVLCLQDWFRSINPIKLNDDCFCFVLCVDILASITRSAAHNRDPLRWLTVSSCAALWRFHCTCLFDF